MSARPPNPQDRGAGAPAVEVDRLVVRYGATTAVDGLSLHADRGEVLAILGPNGAGKTSTVETLEGYRRPADGRVRVLGLDPGADHRALAPRVGVMLQRGGIYPMLGPKRVLELFAAYYRDPEPPDALLDRVSLRAVATTPWRHLSGGEQQRLSLALALVGRPEVVFLDEPTAGVDPVGRIAVREVVAGLAGKGTSVVLTTHELAEAEKMADRVVIVNRGKAVASGTPAALAAGSGEEGSVSFGAPPGLDVVALGEVLGATVTEDPAGRYRIAAPASPALTARLAGWLAERDATLTDLRAGRSLEEAYLAAVGEPSEAVGPDAVTRARRRRR
jgi:ABC-2 type transport system ATP-binding protein